jgi:hypothetical protein
LGLFEGLDRLVAGDYGVTGLGGELDDAGSHRADAENADGRDVVHYRSSFLERSWACRIRFLTRSLKLAKRSSLVCPLCQRA